MNASFKVNADPPFVGDELIKWYPMAWLRPRLALQQRLLVDQTLINVIVVAYAYPNAGCAHFRVLGRVAT